MKNNQFAWNKYPELWSALSELYDTAQTCHYAKKSFTDHFNQECFSNLVAFCNSAEKSAAEQVVAEKRDMCGHRFTFDKTDASSFTFSNLLEIVSYVKTIMDFTEKQYPNKYSFKALSDAYLPLIERLINLCRQAESSTRIPLNSYH